MFERIFNDGKAVVSADTTGVNRRAIAYNSNGNHGLEKRS